VHNRLVTMLRTFGPAVLPALICIGTVVNAAQGKKEEVKSDTPVLDICDALQKIDRLNGSVVAVRGYYRFGMELGGLYGRNCGKKLILDGAVRAQAFDLASDAIVDDKELDAAVDKLIREKDTRKAIQVTLIGVIRARRSDLTGLDGCKARMFGHLGIYPAQIAVQAVRDVTVIDAPDFPSNMDPNRRL